jgi:hypothetical protein
MVEIPSSYQKITTPDQIFFNVKKYIKWPDRYTNQLTSS